jgi:hypothetical protein
MPFTLAYTIFSYVNQSCYSDGIFRQTQFYKFSGVFVLSLAATCFGHLQAILESVYFLFTIHLYLHYNWACHKRSLIVFYG